MFQHDSDPSSLKLVAFQKFRESKATPLEFLNSLAQCLGRVAVPPDLSCSLANALYAAVPPGRGGRLSNVLRSRTLDISPKNIKTRLSIAYLLAKFGFDKAENEPC